MSFKSFTKRIFCCAMLAASVLMANAADRLLIVGNAVWGGFSIDNSIVMFNTETEPDVFKATVYLEKDKDFKFLTETDFSSLEYRAGENDVTLKSGEKGTLVSTDETKEDKKFFVSKSANYDIVCDLVNKTVLVTEAAYQAKAINHNALWIVGDATPGAWSLSDGVAMKQDAVNPFKFTASVDLVAGELKFAINNQTGFGQTMFVRDATDDGKMVFGGEDNKWNITEADKYDITVDVDALTVSIVKSVANAIGSVETAEANAPAEYFTLGGVKVNDMKAGGVYVKRQGTKAVKVVVK